MLDDGKLVQHLVAILFEQSAIDFRPIVHPGNVPQLIRVFVKGARLDLEDEVDRSVEHEVGRLVGGHFRFDKVFRFERTVMDEFGRSEQKRQILKIVEREDAVTSGRLQTVDELNFATKRQIVRVEETKKLFRNALHVRLVVRNGQICCE